MRKINVSKALLPTLIATAVSSVSYAAPALEEVMVTATKRSVSIQDVPFSINAQSQADIQRSGAGGLEDLSRNIAGLSIQNLGPGQSQVAIRGVSAGQIVRDQPGVKEQVGVYLDESVISLSLFTPDFDLFDLNRVETLRGPQGTLFGSGSVGGTLRYITNQPNFDEVEGLLEADLHTVTDGEEGGHLKGAINIPLSDTVAVRAVGYHTEYAGYIDALGEGGSKKEDVNSGTRSGTRITVKFQPSEKLTITPRVVYQEIEADGNNRQEVYNLYANPYTTTRPAIQLDEREQYLLLDESFSDETLVTDLVVNYSFDDFDLTSITSYTERDILVSRDASALTGSVSADFGLPDAGILLPSNLRDTTDVEQTTQELRLSSTNDSPLQWVAGVFYADTDRAYTQRLPTPGYDAYGSLIETNLVLPVGTYLALANGFPANSPYNADLSYTLEQTAIFGEASYDISDQLQLTLGTRFYDYEESRKHSTGGIFSNADPVSSEKTASDGFTSRIMASYDLNDDTTFNTQISQGFRLGGVNDPLNESLCQGNDLATFGGFQAYDDETLTNYEVGVKSKVGSSMTFNAAAFYADIKDLQVTLDAGSCSSRISFNVPEAHTVGIELELKAQPMEGLELTVATSFIESEFDSTVKDGDGNVLGGVKDGNSLASVPEFQIAATASYYFAADALVSGAEAFISATIQHVGERYTQPSDQVAGAGNFTHGYTFGGAVGDETTSVDLELESYELLNLSAGLINGEWETVVYVNNVADENVNQSFDRERGGKARLGFRTNQPRTVGVTVRKSF
ncbi:TonB-dependent receptor [Dasania marina]|uniref:TonB-dependent receptor n=1 Tax=Dasania marina TaxID=471499 RepID=UPI0030D98B85|tara:strand:+ start:10112 stop:12499 length:2388 start_codon:yes stop_codon:yes gene_type:complete